MQPPVSNPVELEDDAAALIARAGSAKLRAAGIACALVALCALLLGSIRVASIERAELETAFPAASLQEAMRQPGSSRISARLCQVELRAGQRAVFELCAADGLPEARWLSALEFLVLELGKKQLLLRVPLDAAHLAHVRRNHSGGCLQLGAGPITRSGLYSLEAVWPDKPAPAAVIDVPLTPHILAKRPLARVDALCVLLLGLGVLSVLVLGLLGSSATDALPSSIQHVARAAPALLALGLLYAASSLAVAGPSLTLVKGMLLFLLQGALAFLLARRFAPNRTWRELGLHAPKRRLLSLLAALCAALLLVAIAKLALRWVPSTAEAPIQTFISWPSGMLAAALLGVLLPAAEELFFRGYLYAALLPMGRIAAAVGSILLFGLMHLEQSWGNWGGLFAIFAAGTVLCTLRVVTGSCLVSALTHVAYNLALSLGSITSGLGS